MSAVFKEPLVSLVVLDFDKPVEARLLLESIKCHVKFDHRVIYLHNGPSDYAYQFYRDDLCDTFIQTRANQGLGLGTRDTFRASTSQFTISIQNDQILREDYTEVEFHSHLRLLGTEVQLKDGPSRIASVSLAGAPCGEGIYSERAHLIDTEFYQQMERNGLPYHGAGPFHDGEWREAAIQRIYLQNRFIHATHVRPLVIDNGATARRENPDGSQWLHYPDTKQLWLKRGPVKERFIYPKLNDEEWASVLAIQSWPDGQIPANEVKDSFHVWH